MNYNFLFVDTPNYYKLLLNGAPVRVFAKSRHSKQDAEDKASDVVSSFAKHRGMSNVFYNGNHSVITLADNFFNKIR